MGAQSTDDLMKLCLGLGMSEEKAKETIKNQQLTNLIKKLIAEVSSYSKKFLGCY